MDFSCRGLSQWYFQFAALIIMALPKILLIFHECIPFFSPHFFLVLTIISKYSMCALRFVCVLASYVLFSICNFKWSF